MIAFQISIQVGDHTLQGLLVNAPESSHHSTEWLADYLYQHHSSDLSVATFVIVRPPVDQPMQEHYFRTRVFPLLRQRLPSLPVYLLGSQNFVHYLSKNLNRLANDPFRDTRRAELLAEIRQEELAMYALHSNALLRTTGTRYFRAPSMKYCQYFMRVGNIQTSRSAIDATFFWLLPWLKDCSAIIAESWTVSSTALNAARLLSRYDPHHHSRCRVDMLSAYHDSSTALRSEAEDIFRRVLPRSSDKVLILVSSCMSGGLVSHVKETFHSSGFGESRWQCGAIFSLSHAHSVPALCDATRLVPESGFSFHEELPEGASVIEIDKRTYFPLRIEENRLNLKKDSAAKFLEFFNLYRKTGLFCVHRNCYEQKGGCSRYLRHHAIDIDVNSILEIEPFASRFEESVRSINGLPKLIIVPPHRAGLQMAQLAKRILAKMNHEVEVLVHPDLKFVDGDPWCQRFSSFSEHDSILVCDDVSVTGSRLASFAQSLRVLHFRGQIHFRVGVARPESENRWKTVCSQLRSRDSQPNHTVDAIHEVVLPNWGNQECPWCAEQRLYTDALNQSPIFDKNLSERLNLLTVDEFSKPLSEGIFVSDHDCIFQPLAPGSIFIGEGATQAALFAATASLIQRMRVGEAIPEMPPPNYPEVSVLDTNNYLGGRFPEASIRAAVMRSSMVSELEAPRHADEISRAEAAVRAIFDEELAKPMILEILLQSKLGKLPPLKLTVEQEGELKRRYGGFVEFLCAR